MTFKKLISLLLALSMMVGLLATVSFAEETATTNLHVTTNVPTTIDTQASGYYLGAYNESLEGSPLCLLSGVSAASGGVRTFPTTTDVNSAKEITVEYTSQLYNDEKTALVGRNLYRLLFHPTATTTSAINITGGVASQNGSTAGNYPKATFTGFLWDAENGVFYQDDTLGEATGKKFILVLSEDSKISSKEWDTVFAENSGYYPVRLFAVSECSYNAKSNDSQHWEECACGNTRNAEDHDYTVFADKNDSQHWYKCACGALGTKADHTWGQTQYDYTAGTQTKTCTDTNCGKSVTEPIHTCAAGTEKGYDENSHWDKCTQAGCTQKLNEAGHTLTWDITTSETQHRQVCACGYATELAGHTFGDWTQDTPATETTTGTRHRDCTAQCGKSETGSIPCTVAEGTYYIAGDVNGTTYYFRMVKSGESVTDTSPYSLYATSDISEARVVVIAAKEGYEDTTTLEKQYTVVVDTAAGTMIYVRTTGTGTSGRFDEDGRHLFRWDAENEVLYKMMGEDRYILAFTEMNDAMHLRAIADDDERIAAGTAWPAKLVAHTHEYSQTLTAGDETHYYLCECGDKKDEADHAYANELSKNESQHWYECACGAKKDAADHNYGDWVNDYDNNKKSRTCADCGYVNTVDLNHTCTPKQELGMDDTHHWTVCSDCGQPIEKSEHTFSYKSEDGKHWQECTCGKATDKVDHAYTWQVTTEATETTAGSKTGTCACGDTDTKVIPPSVKEGEYYLVGKLGDVTYYFRQTGKGEGEGVTTTDPYSLHTTSDKASAHCVNIKKVDDEHYIILIKDPVKVYVYDAKAGNSGIDTGHHQGNPPVAARHYFSWDAENKVLYQMEGDVKYVLAFKTLTNSKTNAEEVRLLAVPVSELSDSVVAAQLELYHGHSYGENWKTDASNHWKECECGDKKDEGAHAVTTWTVSKEATETEAGTKVGKCDVCGYEITAVIPATGAADVEPPKDGETGYLSAVIDGVRYYFRHSASGESVTTTTPNSLYTTTDVSKANTVTVKTEEDAYILSYLRGETTYSFQINGANASVASKNLTAAKVNFLWDEENKLLYQMEGDVKYVLVFKVMDNTKTGAKDIRLAAVPMSEALSDSNVYLAELYNDSAASTGDESMAGLVAVFMALSVCAMAVVVTTRKKFF